MKIIPILTLLICIQLGMWLFDSTACVGEECGNLIARTNDTGSGAYMSSNLTGDPSSTANLWEIILDPTNLENTGWFSLLIALVGVSGVLSVGLYLIYRTDAIILFPVFTALLGFGSYTIINLFNLITRERHLFGCTTIAANCFPANLVAFIVCAPLTLWFVFACIDYWINRQGS